MRRQDAAIRDEMVWFDDDDYHYLLEVYASTIHEHVGQNYINLNDPTTRETFAHEFIPEASASLVKYYQPNGKLTDNMVVFSACFNKHENDKRWNIISSNDSVSAEQRHARNIAIETQEQMREKTGRKIICDIVAA